MRTLLCFICLVAACAGQQQTNCRIALRLTNQSVSEGEPWFVSAEIANLPPPRPLDNREFYWEAERQGVGNAWEALECRFNAWGSPEQEKGKQGDTVFYEFVVADPNICFMPGIYRLRAKVERVWSGWLTVQVNQHAGNRAAFAGKSDRDAWYTVCQLGPLGGFPQRIVDRMDETSRSYASSAERLHREQVAAFQRKSAITDSLLDLGRLQAARILMREMLQEQVASARRQKALSAKAALEAIHPSGFVAPTGGLSAEVMQARIRVLRDLTMNAEAEVVENAMYSEFPGTRTAH